MGKQKSTNSQEVIDKLNTLLIEGIELQNSIINEDRKSFYKYLFSIFLIRQYRKKTKRWKASVTEVLTQYLPNSHYLAHDRYPI